jgi:hypothetical protein
VSEPVARSDSDILVRLNYLDKQFAAYQKVESNASRLWRLQIILSVLVIALATGLVSADENLELTGIKLKLPLWTLLGGGAVGVGVAAALGAVQATHAGRLEESLYAGYVDLGFPAPKENAEGGVGLASSFSDVAVNLWQTTAETPLTLGYWVGTLSILLLLPCVAQIAALLKLASDFGWSWHVWLPLGASLFWTVATLIWFLRHNVER